MTTEQALRRLIALPIEALFRDHTDWFVAHIERLPPDVDDAALAKEVREALRTLAE